MSWTISSIFVPGPAQAASMSVALQAPACRRRRARAVTSTDPGEIQVLVIEAEIRVRIDLGHPEPAAAVAARREIEPGFDVHARVVPVDEVTLTEAHDGAGEQGGFRGSEAHRSVLLADGDLAEPRIAPGARAQESAGRHRRAGRRVGRSFAATRHGGLALERLDEPRHGAALLRGGELLEQHVVQHRTRLPAAAVQHEHEAALLV